MNQYSSRKRDLWRWIELAHDYLIQGEIAAAQYFLLRYRMEYTTIPASTRRRWRCGR